MKLAVTFAVFAASLIPARGQDNWLAVEGGTLFDGTGAALPDSVVLVHGDRIERVGKTGAVDIPARARRVDARGRFVVPGLIDFHFHFNPRHDPRVSPWLPLQFLANGVTTLREMGNWIHEENRAWIHEMTGKGFTVPRLLYSGPVLDGPNTLLPDQSIVLLDELDARREANRLMDQGATSLKVYSRLPLSLMKVVIEEAHRRGVPVHAHLGAVDPRDAIEVGLDGLEHTNQLAQAMLPPMKGEAYRQTALSRGDPGSIEAWATIDPEGKPATELIELMLRHHVNLDATLALHEQVHGSAGPRPTAMRNIAAFTVRYYRSGGSVTMGSHGMVPYAAPGFALQREMELHCAAGMPTAAVLQAATRVAAAALHLNDRGTIAPGKLADLVILTADPVKDIANMTRVDKVILGGQIVDRAALLRAAPLKTGEIRQPSEHVAQ